MGGSWSRLFTRLAVQSGHLWGWCLSGVGIGPRQLVWVVVSLHQQLQMLGLLLLLNGGCSVLSVPQVHQIAFHCLQLLLSKRALQRLKLSGFLTWGQHSWARSTDTWTQLRCGCWWNKQTIFHSFWYLLFDKVSCSYNLSRCERLLAIVRCSQWLRSAHFGCRSETWMALCRHI